MKDIRTIKLTEHSTMDIHLVGCGGTGSWIAPQLARVAWYIKEQRGISPTIRFFDPDSITLENCYRQNFCPAEIGRNKAQALATRFGLAWGVNITAHDHEYELGSRRPYYTRGKAEYVKSTELLLVIGCVDGPEARNAILRYVDEMSTYRRQVWWLDCGNSKDTGQVLLGRKLKQGERPFAMKGYSSWGPLPPIVFPDLLEDNVPNEEAEALVPEHCEQLSWNNPQGMMINQAIAAMAGDYLSELLVFGTLQKHATFLNLSSGIMSSSYIVPEDLEKAYPHVFNEEVKAGDDDEYYEDEDV